MKEKAELRRLVDLVNDRYDVYIVRGYRLKDAYEQAVADAFKTLTRKLDKIEADYVLNKLSDLREGIYGEEAYNEF